jgi:hypothetical protein
MGKIINVNFRKNELSESQVRETLGDDEFQDAMDLSDDELRETIRQAQIIYPDPNVAKSYETILRFRFGRALKIPCPVINFLSMS